ncbi:tRNA (adenine(58)-N(1))-methyltransferase non-catalytic subunit TRM6 [Frankliniella fusca]|uniref:tRNA (adenine(58)-N(1))-methyltransferase non-catalytic subunit TRM6 n=1 Tax=Frankliniella fusca TaxID=407009 RepID=A0AAE1HTH5_9NEOP|nr:tRNA (adenine(58)-N(1))-methyltransferase non-catalytic subunit TRM6 [Frankliniella fusca]
MARARAADRLNAVLMFSVGFKLSAMAGALDTVKAGDYIVIQRQDYFKLHKVSENGTVNLGKDILDIGSVIGKPVWTTYRLEQKKGGRRNYQLKECSITDLKDDSITMSNNSTSTSGTDNRNIVDDGSSQKLSMEEIVSLREEGRSSKEIVGTLIENSTTFHSKTEYSQQKYLKKKEKKYFEYITIRKPTLRLIAEIMFRLDQGKIFGLRIDTLSQIPTAVNLHAHGKYIVFESGCQGLTAAALLNGLSNEGRLVYVHLGNYPSKQALLALNMTPEQENSLICVNIYNLLRKLKSECNGITGEEIKLEGIQETSTDPKDIELKQEISPKEKELQPALEEESVKPETDNKKGADENDQPLTSSDQENSCQNKRKHSESGNDDGSAKKKSRWEVETDRAVSTLHAKADGLVIACREHPSSVLKALLPLIAPSRNFVVYGQVREPLLELLQELIKRPDVTNVRLTDTWLRHYQVESNRTHPLVNMTGSGGYLLTGVKVQPKDF